MRGGYCWFTHSGSGIEFKFNGTEAKCNIVGDAIAGSELTGNYARYAVYVNGKRILDEFLDTNEKEVVLYQSKIPTEVEIRVIKLSEATRSSFGVKEIIVQGNIKPTDDKEIRIEFIGDSITAGYGVEENAEELNYNTAAEDVTKSYAYKAAELLDADYSIVAYSGYGIYSGNIPSGENRRNSTDLVPLYYEHFSKKNNHNEGYYNADALWNFKEFIPDLIIINLGTNDEFYIKKYEKRDDFIDAYISFIETVRCNNPDAYIICTYGIMGNELFEAIENATEHYKARTGDSRVSAFLFSRTTTDRHPTNDMNEKSANELVTYIRQIDEIM